MGKSKINPLNLIETQRPDDDEMIVTKRTENKKKKKDFNSKNGNNLGEKRIVAIIIIPNFIVVIVSRFGERKDYSLAVAVVPLHFFFHRFYSTALKLFIVRTFLFSFYCLIIIYRL